MKEDRLSQTVEFCKLIDREKFVQRRTYLSDGERLENDAEHAWHMAVMALLLSEYANEKVDVLKVVSLLLVHDLVEIYAGDTFAYDEEGKKTQRERELAAAERLFSQLPDEQSLKMRSLWDEFEEWGSPESKFAHTLDNFQPLLLQHASCGRAWKEGDRRLSEVLERNARSAEGSQALWEFARENFIQPEIEAGNLINDID